MTTTVAAPIRHAHAIWALLLERATTEIIEIPLTDDKVECLVFRGKLGELFELSGVSKAYYSKVRKILIDSGAITILARGTVHAPSVVVLDPDNPPPSELPEYVKSQSERLTTATRFDTLERRVEIVEQRTEGIDIVEALRNFEQRLSRVESQRETGES